MILVLDVGNSNVVFGACEDDEVLFTTRFLTNTQKSRDDYLADMQAELRDKDIDIAEIEGGIISSVVPEMIEILSDAVFKLTGKKLLVVNQNMELGYTIRLDEGEQLAGDLIIDHAAAVAEYGAPHIIVDMGTATTITVVDRDGVYLGGAISAGLKLGLRALGTGTALLPDLSINDAPDSVIASNTIDALKSGAVFGAASMVDGMIRRIEKTLGYNCKVIATGGIARHVVPLCEEEIILDRELTLKGLILLYDLNK